MKVYFISGLGADETAFRALNLPGVERIYLNWLEPGRKETMEAYAARMAARIEEPEPIIVGLSFGGMVAIEIAKLIPVKKLILLSSAKTYREVPLYFLFCRHIPLHKLLPLHSISTNTRILNLVFGTRTAEQRDRMRRVINNTINGFNEWAVDQVVKWKNKDVKAPVIHIHGASDWLLPARYVKADHLIKGGGHLMVVNQAKELSLILQEELKKLRINN